jgi:sec-independent protein translocase protein TatA
MLSLSHILLLLLVVFVLFGAKRLPQAMGDLAKGIKAFRDGMRDQEK